MDRVRILVLVASLVCSSLAQAQQIHRNGFESTQISWVKSSADAPFDETQHVITDQTAHDGLKSEFIKLNAKTGNFIYYQYGIGKGLLADEFSASVFVKANRPDMQLLVRVVLPNERDPNNLDTRLTTLLRGDQYKNVGRWQRLEINRLPLLLRQQQQLLQAQLKRPVNFNDAFIDALVLNVYGGPGPTEAYIDDLEVGPLLNDSPFQPAVRPANPNVPGNPTTLVPKIPSSRQQVVEYNGTHLLVGGQKFMIRGIRYSDTPLRVLRDAGFNTLFLDYTASPSLIKEATELGFWIVPELKILSDDSRLSTPEGVASEVARLASHDAVLFWHLGGPLKFEQAVAVSRATQLIKSADPGRPIGANVWDGMLPFSRSLNLLSVHRYPLMGTMEMHKYREWLDQRRRLASPTSYLWTWVPTHVPEPLFQQIFEKSAAPGFSEPIGPSPEQIRLLSYIALASGYKGLGFWSDRWLADSHQGRDRLLACALVNQELAMLEPFLVLMDDTPQWLDTNVPQIKAAVIRTSQGVLVLPIWMGSGSQYVAGQAAANKVSIVVPQIPQSMQAWEVSPADVRSLKPERVTGGTKITLPEFGLTGAVVFTGDLDVIQRFQKQAQARRQLAAQYSYDLALYELKKVFDTNELLAVQHSIPEAGSLILDAQKKLQSAKQLWDNKVFAESYRESQRALRPARILMRAHWDKAVKTLDTPVASPYALTYFTLPKHYQFIEQISHMAPASNALIGGDFEIIPERVQDTWKLEEQLLDDIEPLAVRVGEIAGQPTKDKLPSKTEMPREGKQCAMLSLRPKPGKGPPILERSLLALVSPEVKLPPGTLVQVTGWIRVPAVIQGSPDGAMFYDSIGGEQLGVRVTEPTPWRKFTLYRKMPPSGTMQVAIAMTGLGTVYFDDIRVEPLVPGSRQ